MKYTRIVLLLSSTIYISIISAPCTQGNLTGVAGSPFSTSSTPYFNAYSPIVNGNVFAGCSDFTASSNVNIYSVNTSTGVFTQVSGSPFTPGVGPVGISFSPVVYGNLFAAISNNSNNNVAMFQVNTVTGSLTAVPGSPFAAGANCWQTAFSPLVNGNMFVAVCNNGTNTINVYSMNTVTGALTGVSGSPYTTGPTGAGPRTIAFSPIVNGNLFAAVTNGGFVSNTVASIAVFSVNTSTGVFTAVSGSPFTAGVAFRPTGLAFSPVINGNLFLAITNNANTSGSNNTGTTVAVYTFNTSTGALTQVAGSPFTAGTGPAGIAFSPLVNGNLYAAVSNFTSNNVSVYTVNTSTGVFTLASTTAAGTNPFGMAFSPLMTGGLFLATTNQTSNNSSVFQVATVMPTLTTLSQFILSGASITLNGSVTGGTSPYAITWQDSTVQSGITSTFTRTVSPTTPTIYDIATVSDANACTAGPSNNVTIAVRTCP